MSVPVSVILRFDGDPDDLTSRFEQALGASLEAGSAGYTEPVFFAISKAQDGIVIISGWEAEEDHKAFRKQLMPHLGAAGITRPSSHQQFDIARLGWNSKS